MGCAFIAPKNIKAKAVMSVTTAKAVVIDELAHNYTAGSWDGAFNPDNVSKLYGAISGTSGANATLQSVKTKLTSSTSAESVTGNKVITATDLAAVSTHSGKDIVVTFGGFEWTVVYVSESIGGDLVATLLLVDSLKNGTSLIGSPFASWSETGTNSSAKAYPGNMYSTSQVRSVLMGTRYSKSATELSTVVDGETKQHTGLKAMANDFGSSGVIATPHDMKWQEAENSQTFLTSGGTTNNTVTASCRQVNDAWGTGLTGYATSSANYETKSTYTDWADDYFWIPSVAERATKGSTLSGMWQLTANQRTQTGNKYASSATVKTAWFRSGITADTFSLAIAYPKYGSCVWNTTEDGEGAGTNGNANTPMAIRPAMHLNLSALDKKVLANPADVTTEPDLADPDPNARKTIIYNGDLKNLDVVLPEWYTGYESFYNTYADITYKYKDLGDTSDFDTANPGTAKTKNEVINAGRYEFTIKLKSNSPFTWFDNTGAAVTEKKAIITIEQLEVKYKWKSTDGKLNEANTDPDKRWKVTFDTSFIPTSGISAAPWAYLEYTLLTTTYVADNTDAGSLTYDQINKKAMLGANENISLPCIVVSISNIDQYDNPLDNIYVNKNGTTRPVNGTSRAYPQEVGSYTVSAKDINAETSNYKLIPDENEPALTSTRNYEIERLEINTPALRDPMEYTGDWVEFEIAAFNTKVGTGTSAKWYHEFVQYGNLNSGEFEEFLMPTDDDGNDLGMKHELSGTNQNKLVFKAHDADEYTIYYRLQSTTVENTTRYPNAVVRNYKWKCTSPDSVNDVEGKNVDGKFIDLKRVYEIAPKTLEFSFSSLKKDSTGNFVPANTWDIKTNDETGKLVYTFVAGKEPVVIRTLSADESTWESDPGGKKEEPVLELWYYETSKGDTAAKKPVLKDGDDPAEFIFNYIMDSSNKHTAGEYTIMVKLAAVEDSKPETLVNKNYRVKVTPTRNDGESDADYQKRVDDALKTYRQAMKLKPGEASLDDIAMKYQSETMKEDGDLPADLPYADPDVEGSKNLAYGYNADKEAPLQYFFTANLDDIDFLEIDTSYGDNGYIFIYLDKDGNEVATLGDGEGFAKASKVRVKFKVRVKTDERTNNKMPKASEYKGVNDGGKFTYTPGDADGEGNIFDGVLSFDYEIVKATVAKDDLEKLPLQYQFTGDTKWTTYDPENPPEYNAGKSITFRPDPAKLPQGVKDAEVVSTLGDFKNPGTPTITIKVTVDDNYDEVKNYNLKPTISAQVIDTSADMWKVENLKDGDGENVKDAHGAPYQISTLNPEKLADSTYADYIDYEYWTMVDDGAGGFKPGVKIGVNQDAIDKLIDPSGDYKASSTNSYPVFVRPVLNDKAPTTATGTPKFVLKDKSGNSVEDDEGNGGFMAYNFGESKDLIVVKMQKTSSVYGDNVNASEIFSITYEDNTAFQAEHYTIKIADSKKNDLGLLAGFDFSKADAGVYTITIAFTDPEMAKDFVFTESGGKFTIEKKEIELPTLGEMVFTGEYQSIESCLGGSWEQYKDMITLSGDVKDIRNVSQSGYKTYLVLTNTNYKWAQPAKEPVKLVLTDGDVNIDVTSDDTAEYNWNVAPMVVDASNLWNKGNKGATLNLPESVNKLITGETLNVGYRYYDDAGQYIESPELKGGKSFRVEAVFGGIDAEQGNVLFKTSDGSLSAASDKVSYTVPQSGAGAFFGNALSFVKSHWLWFVIALAILLFLIILICIIAHRRKTKEAREEKKAQKEEEKRRKEEEREEKKRREEAEREERKRKQEAELELAKAKQEAELAKMRAGLGMGAAGMAMAQQAQPQQPQQMPQQPMQQQYQPQPQYQQPQYPQYPQQMPMPMPQQSSADAGVLARLEAQLNAMQAEQRAKYEAEQRMELAAMHAEQRMDREAYQRAELAAMREQLNGRQYMQSNMPAGGNVSPNAAMDMLGALVVSALKSISTGNKPAEIAQQPKLELTQSTDDTVIATPTVYPPDAVITTTTTVDTTKSKPEPVSRDSERNFDIDGFYDTFDMNNK